MPNICGRHAARHADAPCQGQCFACGDCHAEALAAIKAFDRAEGLSPKTGRAEAFQAAWIQARTVLRDAEKAMKGEKK